MILQGLLATLFVLAGTPDSGGDGLVLLDFHSEHCGPCRQMRPEIQILVDNGYPIRTIKLEDQPKVAQRYEVTAVPTLIVVDADGQEVDRSSGYRPAREVAAWFKEVRARNRESSGAQAERPRDAEPADEGTPEEGPPVTSSRGTPVPKPWETTVRIKVHSGNGVVFGSGTIIHSTSEESIILTCAHIFKIEGAARQPTPDRFPHQITVDLFDGVARGGGDKPAQVHMKETHKAQVIDYDYNRDVGLMRIRPGRRIAASPVVPPDWQPQQKQRMITVGSSAGRDATAWETTITNPEVRWNKGYEAIECHHAPIQGRSGGGLYTWEGYVAGVCDFAEATGNHGYYAAPASIHRLLDRNQLQVAYEPRAGNPQRDETLVADAGDDRVGRVERLQSPEPESRRRSNQAPDRSISMPNPDLLGIESPRVIARGEDSAANVRRAASAPARRYDDEGWSVTHTDMELDPAASGEPVAEPSPAPRRPSSAQGATTRTTTAPDGWEVANRPWPGDN